MNENSFYERGVYFVLAGYHIPGSVKNALPPSALAGWMENGWKDETIRRVNFIDEGKSDGFLSRPRALKVLKM